MPPSPYENPAHCVPRPRVPQGLLGPFACSPYLGSSVNTEKVWVSDGLSDCTLHTEESYTAPFRLPLSVPLGCTDF